ncbi:MAG: cytochrome c biogenesis protein CcsA, partial [Rhodoglobus sp.]|nr:cytochrome c biogenesis protein CcsA [Rhodoglobus sp.]
MTETFVTYSVLAVYSAMAVYTLAFILFTLDLARRSAASQAVPQLVAASASAKGGAAVLERTDAPAPTKTPRYLRAAMALTIIAWALHVSAAVLRGLAAGRVPWANMFEFTLTATAIIVTVFLAVQFWQDLRFLGVFITGFALIALGVATVNFYVDVIPLPPALQSVWLVIHVFVASLGTGFFALGAGVSVVQLMKERRLAGKAQRLNFLDTVPAPEKLENTAYRLIVVGFVLWTFTLIAGAIWAGRAWGRYWGWDT